ncbi:tetratricopeptide repeat protein [Allomuricauda sp. CP2A]|uniref:tetratricopeptide repeat protein n=1 Tax=Allomuricauda sp. CP2A TaxID=1848189 RepID=UPI00082AC36C|nr:tetratricopeptide repeat protein [Muricauda sp. CP2A]
MELVGNKETTIAVLPFQIIGAENSMSPIIKGFTEDLIINFSKFIGLSVISQYSTLGISDIADTESIGKLGADYIITGSFRPITEGYRIGIQLIRTKDNRVVFAGNHDEAMETILNAQDTITQQMVNVLQQQIEHDLLSYSYKKESVELAAYENWLLGIKELKKGTVESDLAAREYFKAALKIDPLFARAYTGISLSYFNEWSCQLWDRWEVSQKGAHDYALKAIELDENDYISLAVLGRTFLYLGDYDKSEHLLRKSLRMNPNDAGNLILISNCFVWLGYLEEAENWYIKARNLNPLHPEPYLPIGMLVYFEKGDYKKAIELGEKVANLSIWTDFTAYLAAAYYHLSQYGQMNAYWKKYLELFKRNINEGKEATNQEAVDWQKVVNPYKVKSNLEPFWNFMLGDSPKKTVQSIVPRAEAVTKGKFIHNGDLWELSYLNLSVAIKDCKGLHDIAKLLEQPEKQLNCSELMGVVLETSGTSMIDDQAMKEYKNKIRALKIDIDDAQEMGMHQKADQLRGEYETLVEHLSKVMGLSNKIRKTGSSMEKARAAVTWRIRNAIKKIEKVHPQLAKHLANSIKTGTHCSYEPEIPHEWTV